MAHNNNKKRQLDIRSDDHNASLASDFDYARQVLRDMTVHGQQNLEKITEIAEKSEQPRAFEVASTLIKNTTEAAEKLIQLQKTAVDIVNARDNANGQQPAVTMSGEKNVVFVGSASDLQRGLLENENNDDESDT